MSNGTAYSQLVQVPATQCADGRQRVVPGDPQRSYLMQKLLGVEMCDGTQMPKADSSLPAEPLELIGNWICQGASNN